ncbi:MAG: efflux RND transporter permease subunit [Actinomycetota bacterium]
MMRWIVGSSLRLRRVVVVAAAGLMAVGFMQLTKTPVDVLPEFMPPTVELQTEALGLSAYEVEQLITVPLEQDLLNGIAWLDEIRSESTPGLSSIELVFEPGTNVLRARQLVSERLTEAYALPNVSKPTTMLQPTSSTRRVLMIGMTSETLSLIDMSVLARWTIKPRLQGVPGVANVSIWGQRERQLQVRVDPRRLSDTGVTLQEVIATTGNALWVSPLSFLEASTPGTGGFIDTPNQRLGIQHLLPIQNAGDLANVTVSREGQVPLRLGDVAQVVEDHQPLIGDAVLPSGPGLMLVVEKFPDTSTLEVTQAVEDALTELQPGMADVRFDSSMYRPADYLQRSIDNVGLALIIGAVLLILLLGAFFYDWRTALIGAVAMPVALAVALIVLRMRDVTVNMIVVAGLAMALVALVDDAVVGVESIVRRLRRTRLEGSKKSTILNVLDATLETRKATFFATLVVALAVVPLFFFTGIPGAFFPPLATSYLLAVAASMAVALTVTPALGMLLLAGAPLDASEPPLVRRLQGASERTLKTLIARPGRVLIALGAVAAIGLATFPFIQRGPVLPAFKEPVLLVDVDAAPGTSHPEMTRIIAQAGAEVRTLPGVANVGSHVGRAITSDQESGVNTAEMWIAIDPAADYAATIRSVEEIVTGYPGLDSDVLIYSNERVTDLLTGIENDVVVRVFGEDLNVLTAQAQQVQTMLTGIDGVVEPLAQLPIQEPTIEVKVDLAAAQRYEIKPGDVRRAATTLLSGLEVGNLFEDNKVFEVVVWGTPEIRSSLEAIRNLPIDRPAGGQVRLADVAQVSVKPNPNTIHRESVSRTIDVTANVRGRGLGDVIGEIEQSLSRMDFPLEYHAALLQDSATRQADFRRTLALVVAAAAGILLLLQAALGSWRNASLVFLSMPVALTGGLLGALAVGRTASLGMIGGLFAVFFIAARNGILLLSRYRDLERDSVSGTELALRGARERIGPVVMTALGTSVALLPILILGDRAGSEILRPMASVIVLGLVTSTLYSALALPVLYLRFASRPEALSLDDEIELTRGRVIALEPEEASKAGSGVVGITATEPNPTT